MNAFPLIKTKWSNERVMAAVFSAAALYMLPGWVHNPASILGFVLVLSVGLAIDVAVNYMRHKRPVCAVSAAVTVAILQALTPGVPLWGELLHFFVKNQPRIITPWSQQDRGLELLVIIT